MTKHVQAQGTPVRLCPLKHILPSFDKRQCDDDVWKQRGNLRVGFDFRAKMPQRSWTALKRMCHQCQLGCSEAFSSAKLLNTTGLQQLTVRLKGKLASLEDFISMQNEELAAQRQEIESLRSDKVGMLGTKGSFVCSKGESEKSRLAKAGIEEHYQGQLQD